MKVASEKSVCTKILAARLQIDKCVGVGLALEWSTKVLVRVWPLGRQVQSRLWECERKSKLFVDRTGAEHAVDNRKALLVMIVAQCDEAIVTSMLGGCLGSGGCCEFLLLDELLL